MMRPAVLEGKGERSLNHILVLTPQEFRHLREDAGLTRIQLADELGVDERTIQCWEDGSTKPTDRKKIMHLVNLTEAGALGFSLQEAETILKDWESTIVFSKDQTPSVITKRKETEMSNEPKAEYVRGRMKGLMEHAEKTFARAESIAIQLGLGIEQAEEKPDAESGPIGLIICRIGSVHSILTQIDDALDRISAELGRL